MFFRSLSLIAVDKRKKSGLINKIRLNLEVDPLNTYHRCVYLTFNVGLRVTVVSAQPLKQRSHHLGTAEALEAGPNILVVPFQSPNLEDPGKKKLRN